MRWVAPYALKWPSRLKATKVSPADAAHAVVRVAAPLTTFIAGYAAGRAGGKAEDVREAIDAASALCVRVAEEA